VTDVQSESKFDARAFRNTLGRFATGVTVVTTVVEEKIHGMTASAFMSLSLDPPLVVVSVDRRANLHSLLKEGSRYGVSILTKEQQAYSQHFAGFGAEDLTPEFVWAAEMPLIKDALAYVVAHVVDAHPAGDHTLFIGQVEHLEWRDGAPLLYFGGRYGDLVKREA
jgi:flavin reductase (DIM6/NTAB) family NADH-FMN oxidoreductase RutF